METIEITDGVVNLVEKRVIRSVYVKSFKEAVVATIGFRSPILPSNTVVYAQKSSTSLYVLESPPSMRSIKHKGSSNRIKEYNLPIPYAYFIPVFKAFALEELFLFFSPKKVENMDYTLYKPPLTNIFPDCKVCLGDYKFNVQASIPTKVSSVIDFFWTSAFNTEADSLYSDAMPRKVKGLSEGNDYYSGWQKIPVSEICDIDWKKYKSVSEILDYIIGEIDPDDEEGGDD